MKTLPNQLALISVRSEVGQNNFELKIQDFINCEVRIVKHSFKKTLEKMTSVPLVMRVMALSINTAKRAGCIIRDVMQNGNLGIVEKGKDDLQTEADRQAQKCIIGSLYKQFPAIKIIGEEEGLSAISEDSDCIVKESDEDFLKQCCPKELSEAKEDDFVIWVDPLDGTSEYTQGFLDHVTVLIGVAIKNSAVGGVIHQPYFENASGELGRTIWGLKGLGVGGFEPVLPPKDEFIVTTTRSHSNDVVQAALEAFSPTKILRVGGAGFKVLQLLDGKAHAYVYASAGCKKWDTCAPEAVLEAYGGVLTDMLGSHYCYGPDVEHPNRMGVFGTVSYLNHFELIKKIPDNVIQSLKK